MTIERYIEAIPQSSDAVPKQLPLERGPGNFLLLVTAGAAVTVTLNYHIQGGGAREVFAGITAGLYLRRVKRWDGIRIDGAVGTSVTFFYGDEITAKDETDIRQQIAVIGGVTAVADQPASVLNAVTSQLIATANRFAVPANAARRRITVCNPANGTGPVYLQSPGLATANVGIPVAQGTFVEIKGTYAFDVRNDSGANQTISFFEEQ